jgi:hypothetical protein
MAKIEMIIDSVRVNQMNYQRVVVLKEQDGSRILPIWVGSSEGDAIAVKMQGVFVLRPLTYDFVCQIIDSLEGNVESAIIDELKKDTFYAKLVLSANSRQIQIDCRPSDALAVAVRKGVPIFVDDAVLKFAGILLDEETDKPIESSSEEAPVEQEATKGNLSAFSESVQNILNTSEAEAKRLNCSYVCTGHLLLALVEERNIATEVLKNIGVNLAKIQLDIETSMKDDHNIEGGGTGLTLAVKEAIQVSIIEAKRLAGEKVLPEHILLGLVRANDGIVANRLKDAGINPEVIYVELIRLYAGTSRWYEGQSWKPSN